MGCVVYLYLTGFWQASGGANGRRVTGCGRVGAQQVVEGGRYISASAGGITAVYSVDVSKRKHITYRTRRKLKIKNVGTKYFKHGIYSPFFYLQNAVCFIILTYLVPVLFKFYIQSVLKLKKNNSGAKK